MHVELWPVTTLEHMGKSILVRGQLLACSRNVDALLAKIDEEGHFFSGGEIGWDIRSA